MSVSRTYEDIKMIFLHFSGEMPTFVAMETFGNAPLKVRDIEHKKKKGTNGSDSNKYSFLKIENFLMFIFID